MKLDTNAVWHAINHSLAADGSVAAKMHRVIETCAASLPHADWQEFGAINYTRGVRELSSWFENAVAADPPEITIRGLWVGICNPVVDGEVTADMYFSGAERFDREDPDWAGRWDWHFPPSRFANF